MAWLRPAPASTHEVALGRPSLEVRNLTKIYEARGKKLCVFEGLSFRVPERSFVAVVGPSGCGKTTILLCIAGLLDSSQGDILATGERVDGPAPDRRGVIFQEPNLLPWRTVIDNVAFPLELKRVNRQARHARAREYLDLVGLTDFAYAYPNELSGGMKQRVSIARGLVQDPQILLMDEPFAALDEQSRMKMGAEVLRIWEQTRKTVLFVTHNLTEAVFLSDQVIVLGARPATILDTVTIDLPRPRTYDVMATEQFGRLRDRIWRQIMDLAADELHAEEA